LHIDWYIYLFFQGRGARENKVIGKLNNNTPAVPPAIKENELSSFRKSLPIYELREHILKLISENQVQCAINWNSEVFEQLIGIFKEKCSTLTF